MSDPHKEETHCKTILQRHPSPRAVESLPKEILSAESNPGVGLFWLCCVALSWFASSLLIGASYESFQENPISFGVETTYLGWDTHFPSIIVCEGRHDGEEERFEELATKLYPDFYDEDSELADYKYDLEDVIKGVVFYLGSTYVFEVCYDEDGEFRTDLKCPTNNFTDLVKFFRRNCTELFHMCSWNNRKFDCCTYFLELETELGMCYAINNLNTKIQRPYSMVSNITTGPGFLKLHLLAGVTNVFVFSKEEVPTLNTLPEDKILINLNRKAKIHVKVNEIENNLEVRDVPISKRKCRFPDENNLDLYPIYSSSGCLVSCRKKLQIDFCNCTSYFMPGVDPAYYCDLEGLKCLDNRLSEFTTRRTGWSNREKSFYCPCFEGCETSAVDYVHWLRDISESSESPYAELEIKLDHLPNELFKRTVVRGKLDLVVSMGGAAGLFVGASLLSFIEFIYFFTVRLYGTLKVLKTQKPKNEDDLLDPSPTPVEVKPVTPPPSMSENVPAKGPLTLQQVLAITNNYYTMPPPRHHYRALHEAR